MKKLLIVLFMVLIFLPFLVESVTAVNKFKINDKVKVTQTVNVRLDPTTSGNLLGKQVTGSLGTIVSGPVSANGYNWWKVNYNNGQDGWSVETGLALQSTIIIKKVQKVAPRTKNVYDNIYLYNDFITNLSEEK